MKTIKDYDVELANLRGQQALDRQKLIKERQALVDQQQVTISQLQSAAERSYKSDYSCTLTAPEALRRIFDVLNIIT